MSTLQSMASPAAISIRAALLAAGIPLAVLHSLAAQDAAPASVPGTSFQTAEGWAPSQDIRADAAIVHSNLKDRMDSWASRGYVVQTMGGFRTGNEYINDHAGEGQTDRGGTILTCGPGSYYMVPTEARIQAMVDYFLAAIRNGSAAVIPEEPEFFARAGYSQSFKDAWQKHYNEPWQDPATSFDTRIKAEQLKGGMELRMIEAILKAAGKENPAVRRMLAHHSPVNYHSWGISFPFHDFAAMPDLQEAIGQVWTGTARTPCPYEGVTKERTFENALLEYSSLVEVYRGTGKRLWFLADPLEDNADRTMEDYRENYTHTLVASLMFPEVNAYELLPWPGRIYGRIPEDYGTVLGCVFNALKGISKTDPTSTPQSRIGVLIGDSAAYQRADPQPNDLTGFYGLTLPFVYEGVPIRIAPIERTVEKGYLDGFRVLLLSYDFFKPMKPEFNTALAEWVKAGGLLVLVGGSNAYNSADQWWRKDGFASPDEHLLKELGLKTKRVPMSQSELPPFELALKADGKITDNSNLAEREIPLPPQADSSGGYLLRFRDAYPDDGWGAYLKELKIQVSPGSFNSIVPGSGKEADVLLLDRGSVVQEEGVRFADGSSSFVYLVSRLESGRKLLAMIGNQFLVETAAITAEQVAAFKEDGRLGLALTAYDTSDPQMKPYEESVAAVDPGSADWQQYIDSPLSVRLYQKTTTARGFNAEIGKGKLVFVDLPAEEFSRGGGAVLTGAVRSFLVSAGETYPSSYFYLSRRGVCAAAHAMGSDYQVEGRWVDLFDATLPVLIDPFVKAGQSRLFAQVPEDKSIQIIAASYETQVLSASENDLVIRNVGPLGIPAAIRIAAPGRRTQEVTATDATGAAVEAAFDDNRGTTLLTFPGSPDGVTLKLRWEYGYRLPGPKL